jgi:hypothetical protein
MGLKVTHQGRELVIPENEVAVVGADPAATIRVARPGISRRHAVLKHDGFHWVVQDTASRNGTYHEGTRIQTLDINDRITVRLGHPDDGEELALEPTADAPTADAPAGEASLADTAVAPTAPRSGRAAPSTVNGQELDDLIATLQDTVSSIRGLTWSVWGMIAVTAILAILTIFVAIIGT